MTLRQWLAHPRRVTLYLYGRGELRTLELYLGRHGRDERLRWRRSACSMGWGWSEASYEDWLAGIAIYVGPFRWTVRHVCGGRARSLQVVGVRDAFARWWRRRWGADGALL